MVQFLRCIRIQCEWKHFRLNHQVTPRGGGEIRFRTSKCTLYCARWTNQSVVKKKNDWNTTGGQGGHRPLALLTRQELHIGKPHPFRSFKICPNLNSVRRYSKQMQNPYKTTEACLSLCAGHILNTRCTCGSHKRRQGQHCSPLKNKKQLIVRSNSVIQMRTRHSLHHLRI